MKGNTEMKEQTCCYVFLVSCTFNPPIRRRSSIICRLGKCQVILIHATLLLNAKVILTIYFHTPPPYYKKILIINLIPTGDNNNLKVGLKPLKVMQGFIYKNTFEDPAPRPITNSHRAVGVAGLDPWSGREEEAGAKKVFEPPSWAPQYDSVGLWTWSSRSFFSFFLLLRL